MADKAEQGGVQAKPHRQGIQDGLAQLQTDLGARLETLADQVAFGIGNIGDLLYDLQPDTREQEVAKLLRDLGYPEQLIPLAATKCHEFCSGDDTVGTYCGSVMAGQGRYRIEDSD